MVSDLNKNFGGSTDLAKNRHGSTDLRTPTHPSLFFSQENYSMVNKFEKEKTSRLPFRERKNFKRSS